MEFNTGDVVSIKSSTFPRMTVAKVDSSGQVICQWFVENDLKEASFQKEMLRLSPDYKASIPLERT